MTTKQLRSVRIFPEDYDKLADLCRQNVGKMSLAQMFNVLINDAVTKGVDVKVGGVPTQKSASKGKRDTILSFYGEDVVDQVNAYYEAHAGDQKFCVRFAALDIHAKVQEVQPWWAARQQESLDDLDFDETD